MIFENKKSYRYFVNINMSTLEVMLSNAAHKKITNNSQNMHVEMQTHLGCMPRKKVVFNCDENSQQSVKVINGLTVSYLSLLGGDACAIGGDKIEMPDQIKMIGTPKWLKIDFRRGKWLGCFTLVSARQV